MSKIIKVYLEFSFRCNLKCKFCYAGDIQNKENIKTNYFDFKDFDNIIQKIDLIFCDIGYIYDIDILGGESLLNKKFIDIIYYIKKKYLIRYINLTTNGTLLNKKFISNLKKNGITHFRISLHGLEYKHNILVGGKQVFKKVINSLKILNEFNSNIVLIFVYNDFNKTDFLKLIVFLKKEKIMLKNLFIEFIEFSGFGLNNINLLNLEYNKDFKKYFNKQLYYVNKIYKGINIALSNFPKCMLEYKYYKYIDDTIYIDKQFELYIPRLVRKTFQGFDEKSLDLIVLDNIIKGYSKSYQKRISKKFILDKCMKCLHNKECYLLFTESILYDYLGLETHKRKHYFELNNTIGI